MLCHPSIPPLHGVLENQKPLRLSTLRMDPSFQSHVLGKFTTQSCLSKAKCCSKSKGHRWGFNGKTREGREKEWQKHWNFIFKRSVWIKQESIAQPEFDFQAWLGVFFLVVWGLLLLGFFCWVCSVVAFFKPYLICKILDCERQKNPPHVLKGFGSFICSSLSISAAIFRWILKLLLAPILLL